MSATSLSRFRVVVAVLVLLVAGSALAERERAKRPFGPWDAGEKREVVRQGRKGLPRPAHPMLGDAAKVPASGPPAPPIRRDPDVPEDALAQPNAVRASLSANPLYLAALFYSRLLTKADGARCRHLPTCSRFASQAVARHGALGIVMGLDRLIQTEESSAIRHLPEVEWWGQMRVFDPVDNYEIWKPERFTGFPPKVPEEPPRLPPILSPAESAQSER